MKTKWICEFAESLWQARDSSLPASMKKGWSGHLAQEGGKDAAAPF
jgi:hypothetical protein